MNRIGIPWYNRRNVHVYKEEIKQIGQDTFTKHVTLFIAKFSIAKENLAMRNKIRWKYNLQKMNLYMKLHGI